MFAPSTDLVSLTHTVTQLDHAGYYTMCFLDPNSLRKVVTKNPLEKKLHHQIFRRLWHCESEEFNLFSDWRRETNRRVLGELSHSPTGPGKDWTRTVVVIAIYHRQDNCKHHGTLAARNECFFASTLSPKLKGRTEGPH